MFVVSKRVKSRLKISGDNRTAVVCTLQTRYYGYAQQRASVKTSELQRGTLGSGFLPESEPLKQVGGASLTNT